MRKKFYTLIFIAMLMILNITIAMVGISKAQVIRKCGTMENLERLKMENPGLAEQMKKIEEHTTRFVQQGARVSGIVKIPVVVHVVYNTSSQNISDAQIQSQITVLNEDFRRTNADKTNTPSGFSSLAADAEIEFCLATISLTGAATTGIVRKSTSTTSFSDDDGVKYSSSGGDNAWDASKYLNLWVCNLGGGLLGYAQFPGGPSSTDGVVINYQYFGRNGTAVAPYNKGRTASHEVGHWLNLYHIWGDDGGACTGSDNVSDTPNQGAENYGCPTYPKTDGCTASSPGVMFMNYMDYTDDACMNMLSTGQKSRMRALFDAAGARVSLLSSNGCGGTVTPAYCSANGGTTQYEWINNVTLNTINNTTTGAASGYADYTSLTTSLAQNSSYTISLKPAFASSTYTEYFKVYIDYNNDKDFTDAGEDVYTSAGTTTTVTGTITIPSTATAGTTRMRVMMSDGAISSSCGTFTYGEVEDYSVNITTGAPASCGTPSGLSASSITSTGATLNWASVSGAISYNVRYKATASATWLNTTSTITSKAVSSLTASTQYEFQVQAVCSVTGSYSASTTFITSAASTVISKTVTVGTGTGTTTVAPYGTYYMDERVQFIITQAELVAAGWTSANSYLRSLAFYVTTASSQVMNGFTIKVAHTSSTSFSSTSFATATFTTVYSGSKTATTNSWNTHTFTTAFNYNGTSNLLVEICWNNSTYTTNSSVQYTATSAYRTLYYRADNATAGVCSNTTGTRTYNRPNMRMVFKNAATGRYGETEDALLEMAAKAINVQLYPNPASSVINVDYNVLYENSNVFINIYDMKGALVSADKQDNVATGEYKYSLDLNNEARIATASGMYFCTVNINGTTETKRFILVK